MSDAEEKPLYASKLKRSHFFLCVLPCGQPQLYKTLRELCLCVQLLETLRECSSFLI
ncbi:hypothetical protein [Nostoc sp.]|uniref:hypothetical protein n=1 Tax=Nostoc sp. TaxID=1180 RepID=UPI002FF80AA9